jgi:hypothetical protein
MRQNDRTIMVGTFITVYSLLSQLATPEAHIHEKKASCPYELTAFLSHRAADGLKQD